MIPLWLVKYGKQIAIVLFIVLIGLVGYRQGVKSERGNTLKLELAYKKEVIDLQNKNIEEMNKLLEKYSEISQKYEQDIINIRQSEKDSTKILIKEIEKPVYKQCLITQEAFDKHTKTVDELNKATK